MTREEKLAWATTIAAPHMQSGMDHLKDMSSIDAEPDETESGEHALVVSAAKYWFKKGQASILKEIMRMGFVPPENKPEPPPFQAPKEFRDSRQ